MEDKHKNKVPGQRRENCNKYGKYESSDINNHLPYPSLMQVEEELHVASTTSSPPIVGKVQALVSRVPNIRISACGGTWGWRRGSPCQLPGDSGILIHSRWRPLFRREPNPQWTGRVNRNPRHTGTFCGDLVYLTVLSSVNY